MCKRLCCEAYGARLFWDICCLNLLARIRYDFSLSFLMLLFTRSFASRLFRLSWWFSRLLLD